MKALKFKLSGKTAFFKKPDVNSYYYFTYGNIHKVALLGMFGAILGYGGYNQHRFKLDNIKDYKESYPEFYSKLNKLKISIEPLNNNGYIPKKIQVFNNSVGYASQEAGGNLIVKEQWLENPKWNIYILLDNEEANNLSDYIVNNRTVYQTYLGKNDHYANISEVKLVDVKKISNSDSVKNINSLCPKNYIEFDIDNEGEEELYKYSERLPLRLNEITNMYELESFVFSNMLVESINIDDIYVINDKNIVFF